MLLDVSTSKDNLLDGSLRRQRQQEGPVFVTEQSLFGFAAMTAVVQLIWKTFQKEGGAVPLAESRAPETIEAVFTPTPHNSCSCF
jgi:hypothetical protein